jgi:hypothetical protein
MRLLALSLCMLALADAAVAQTLHPWQVPAPRLSQQAHFTNLQDGASIETPFVLKFGLTGFGIAPITKPQAKTGHHHLLINRELPLDFNKPLPFDEQYVHFGKGQMETVLTLKPGDYTLRLVLADHRHVPNSVYSKPIKVKVTKFNEATPPDTLSQPGVALMLPQVEVPHGRPMQVLFHASKLNVSHPALKEPGTGHFRLTVAGDGGRTEVLDFAGGETETWLVTPRGRYTLKLDFIDNVDGSKTLHSSAPARISVGL